jgi:hypothetical protein
MKKTFLPPRRQGSQEGKALDLSSLRSLRLRIFGKELIKNPF